MFEMVSRWYKRRFSDPHAASLVAILLFGFITIYFFGHLIALYWWQLYSPICLSGPLLNCVDYEFRAL